MLRIHELAPACGIKNARQLALKVKKADTGSVISMAQIYRYWKNEVRLYHPQSLALLAAVLGVPVWALFEDAPLPERSQTA